MRGLAVREISGRELYYMVSSHGDSEMPMSPDDKQYL